MKSSLCLKFRVIIAQNIGIVIGGKREKERGIRNLGIEGFRIEELGD